MTKVKIGLEVHAELTTKTKLFCGCSSAWQGKRPNTNCCPTCLGLPGSKPRVNEKAIEYGIKIGLALNCRFPKETFFSRKSYFYPDMSKNFQITQYEIPLAMKGYVMLDKKKIGIRRIHLEEDPARLVHSGGSIAAARYVLIDYNRSGVPLCEIVTEPDFESPKEARMFLQKLSSILEYLNVYDSLLEGSMRVDANISIDGGERVEIKNISGFKQVEKALTYEIIRQVNMKKRGRKIVQETRGFDPVANVTILQRTKEFESEYGYIFEPDLTRIEIKNLNKIKKELPELPDKKLKRYSKIVKKEIAESLISDPQIADMFDVLSKRFDPHLVGIWLSGPLKKTLNYNNLRLKDTKIKTEHMERFFRAIEEKKITDMMGEMILREMVKSPKKIEELGTDFTRIDDEESIKEFVRTALAENPKAVLEYKSGKIEVFEFLVGQAMKKSKGRADPKIIRKVLEEMI